MTVVDDSYNASPRSVIAALDLLAGLPGRRGAVLGEMLELGDASDEGHREVGEAAGRTVDWLMVVGAGAAGHRRGCRGGGPGRRRAILNVRDADAALAALPPRLRDGDVVLVKASRGVALDTVVDGLRRELGDGPAPMTSEFAQVELIQGLLLAFALMVILMSPYIRAPARARVRQADPPGGPGEPLRQGGHADDGRPPHRRRRHRHLLLPARRAGRVDLRAARGAGRGRRCLAPSTTTSTPGRGRASAPARSSSG